MKRRLVTIVVALALVGSLRLIPEGASAEVVPSVKTFQVRSGQTTWPLVAAAIVAEASCPVQSSASLTAFGQLLRQGTSSQPTNPHVNQMVDFNPSAVPCSPAPTTTTTVAATTTTAPTTTGATTTTSSTPATTSSPSTTVAPSSTTEPPSSTTSTTLSPTTTTQAPGVAFSEDFSTSAAFYDRFDHGYSGGEPLGPEAITTWSGDHDMACGDPAATHRDIHIGLGAAAKEPIFYPCLPGGDPAKGHVMTSVNTVGYNIAWFSPKQTFTNVKRVCWSQNYTDLGGGKWTQVIFATPAEVARATAANGGRLSLGFVSPEFADPNGPGTEAGPAAHGLKLFGGLVAWSSLGEWNEFKPDTVQRRFPFPGADVTDKAARYQICVTDNGNGTLTGTRAYPDGTVRTGTVQGDIPDGPVRVVFEDDNYDPPKRDGYSPNNLSWHWDNIEVS